MYNNFILKESIIVEKFIMNHFDYCSNNKYVDEEELAKFVIRNIKNGFMLCPFCFIYTKVVNILI